MPLSDPKRTRMILELPAETQMAIRLRAAKNGWTNGAVVAEAVRHRYAADLREARAALERAPGALDDVADD